MGPLFSALEGYDLWFTGLRRQQSASRANLAEVEPFRLPSGNRSARSARLPPWTTNDVWLYAQAHDIPLLPLYELGYTSIGISCACVYFQTSFVVHFASGLTLLSDLPDGRRNGSTSARFARDGDC